MGRMTMLLGFLAALVGLASPSSALGPPVGACCLSDGSCNDTTFDQVACESIGGTFAGAGVACDGPACGSCCFYDGTCLVLPSEAICEGRPEVPGGTGLPEGFGGTWIGFGADPCAGGTADCEGAAYSAGIATTGFPPTLPGCAQETHRRAVRGDEPFPPAAAPTVFGGAATLCGAAPPVGPCCLMDGSCQDATTETMCNGMGGTWLGTGGIDCSVVPASGCYAEVYRAVSTGIAIGQNPREISVPKFDLAPIAAPPRELTRVISVMDSQLNLSIDLTNNAGFPLIGGSFEVVGEIPHEFPVVPSVNPPPAPLVNRVASQTLSATRAFVPNQGGEAFYGDFLFGFDRQSPYTPVIGFDFVDLFDSPDDLCRFTLDAVCTGAGGEPLSDPFDTQVRLSHETFLDDNFPIQGGLVLQATNDDVLVDWRVIYFFAPETGTIRGRIWDDAFNCDGCQDDPADEPGVVDATVELWLVDAAGAVLEATATTDVNGNYEFLDLDFNLPGETYEVRVDRSTLPGGYDVYDWTVRDAFCDPDPLVSDTLDSDMHEAPGTTIGFIPDIVISEAAPISEYNDGGLIEPDFEISGVLWLDANEDGCRDAGEMLLSGINVELWRISPGPATLVAMTMTNGFGEYSFDDATINGDAGDVYEVRIPFFNPGPPVVNPGLEDPAAPGFSYILTFANQNCDPDDLFDSDFTNGGTFAVAQVTLVVDEDIQDPIDLCLYPQRRDAGFRPYEEEDQCGCREKGSLLIFHKIDLRWDEAGNIVQNTFLQFANDFPADVRLQGYIVNGDDPILDPDTGEVIEPGWNFADIGFELTKDQPFYYDCFTGQTTNGGFTPFTVLDPDGRPASDGPAGERMLRGFMLLWAVDANNEEIRWNHLAGTGTLINYAREWSWEYRACSSVVVSGVANGQAPDATPGQLLLDGFEYSAMPGMLLNTFNAVGSNALSRTTNVLTDNDLTFLPVSTDLRANESEGPVTTYLEINIWNENEVKFSNTSRCISCWDQTLMSDYDEPNQFLVGVLQTNFGKARYDGITSPTCDGSIDAAIIGLRAGIYSLSSERMAASAVEMIDLGCEDAVIRYDPLGPPPEAPKRIGRLDGESVEEWLVRVSPFLSDRFE